MIRYFLAGVVATHLVYSLVLLGLLWWTSRPPRVLNVLPFKKGTR